MPHKNRDTTKSPTRGGRVCGSLAQGQGWVWGLLPARVLGEGSGGAEAAAGGCRGKMAGDHPC